MPDINFQNSNCIEFEKNQRCNYQYS